MLKENEKYSIIIYFQNCKHVESIFLDFVSKKQSFISLLFENVIHQPFAKLYNMDKIQQHNNHKNMNPKIKINT